MPAETPRVKESSLPADTASVEGEQASNLRGAPQAPGRDAGLFRARYLLPLFLLAYAVFAAIAVVAVLLLMRSV